MTEREDHRLVEYLYGELPADQIQAFEDELETDAALSEALDGFDEALELVRSVEDEAPSDHLDSLILATARQEVEQTPSPWYKKLFSAPGIGVLAASTCAVLFAVVYVPLQQRSEAPSISSVTAEAVEKPAEIASPAAATPPPASPKREAESAPEPAATELAKAASAPRRTKGNDGIERADGDSFADAFGTVVGGKSGGEGLGLRGAGQGGGGVGTGIGGLGTSGSGRGYGAGVRAKKKKPKTRPRTTTAFKPPAPPPPPENRKPAPKPAKVANEPAPTTPTPMQDKTADKTLAKLDERPPASGDSVAGPSDTPAKLPARQPATPSGGAAPGMRKIARAQRMEAEAKKQEAAEDDLLDDEAAAEVKLATKDEARSVAEKEAQARMIFLTAKKRAEVLSRQGNVKGARAVLIDARNRLRGTRQEWFVAFALARLEIDVGETKRGLAYAEEISRRAPDPKLREDARQLVARARRKTVPTSARPKAAPASSSSEGR